MARYVFHHALPGAPTSGSTAYAAVHIDDDGAAAAGERVRIGDDVVLKTTSADPLLARVMSIILNDATTSSSGGGCLRVQWYFRGSELPFLQDARFAKVRRPGVDESARGSDGGSVDVDRATARRSCCPSNSGRGSSFFFFGCSASAS